MSETERTELEEWPLEKTFFLTLDFECDYGNLIEFDSYVAAQRIDLLIGLLEHHDVPLSCFLQTELLDEVPTAVRKLEAASVPVEFHSHTHTHPPRSRADVEYEVRESVRRIEDRYGTEPLGFRFPDGKSEPTDYPLLADHGVSFNASLFPSWRPGQFNNVGSTRYPFETPSGVLELPFAVYSEAVRVPVSLSYMKLLGRPFYRLVQRFPPSVVVFDMHMHDLYVPPSFRRLSPFYKAVFERHKYRGATILDETIRALKARGYEFGLMSDLAREVRQAVGP